MKHFRPIKTFGTWLLESVKVPFTPVEGDNWGGSHADKWIQEELRLRKADRGDLGTDIYQHTYTGFPSAGMPCMNNFNFPSSETADRFHAEFGGERSVLDMADNPRKNEAIFGNFTIEDLKHLYGDPLPNVIAYHLIDMQDRLSGYFDRFKFMHQEWAKSWIPAAFVYAPASRQDYEKNSHLRFIAAANGTDNWTSCYESSITDIYEFEDARLAALFKLRFGGASVPEQAHFSRPETFEKLKDHVLGIRRLGDRNYIWEKPVGIPDYRNPLTVD